MPENGNVASMELSTGALAAQLAPHLSQASEQHQFNRETFSQLRKELLEGRCSQLNLEDSVADVNNLVCIVVKAGLEIGNRSDNLSITSDVDGQILDCLDIIQAAVEKVPQVLLEPSSNEISGNEISAPLYFWLSIRLIDLLCNCNQSLLGRIRTLLSCIVCSQYRLSPSRAFSFSISNLMRTFIRGMRNVLGPRRRLIHCRRNEISRRPRLFGNSKLLFDGLFS